MAEARFAGPSGVLEAQREQAIAGLESALQSQVRVLKQARLHEFLFHEAGVDMDRAGAALLYALFEADTSLRVGDLAERLHIDTPSVSRKASKLEHAGLITRTCDEADRRAIRLRLTDAGRATLEAVLEARRTWLATVLADWTAAELVEFAHALRRFAGGVDRHLEVLDG